MPGITDPAQEYFKDGVWAWVTDQWKKLVADASNFLQVNVAAQDIDVEVKQTTAADLTPGVMGWDGSAWRRLPVLWGYSDTYNEVESSANVGAGNQTLTFSTVPSGEVWIITAIVAVNTANNITRIELRAHDGGTHYTFRRETSPLANIAVEWSGKLVLNAGDALHAFFAGCLLNDDLYAYAVGYKMKVAE